jgi:hypothetical protein
MSVQNDAYLDAGMRGFIVNTAKREFWKVAGWYEFEDLVQDGYLCFYKCRQRLHKRLLVDSPTKEQRREVQAYVKTAFFNHISTLASKRMAVREITLSNLIQHVHTDQGDVRNADVWNDLAPPQMEEATLLTMLTSAPAEIKQLVQLLVSDGLDLLKFERKRTKRRLLRETTNEYYCRILNLDPKQHDIVEQLKDYFP